MELKEGKYYYFKGKTEYSAEFICLVTKIVPKIGNTWANEVYFKPVVGLNKIAIHYGDGEERNASMLTLNMLYDIIEVKYNGDKKEDYPEYFI